MYTGSSAVHNSSKYRYPHELPHRPGLHEAVHRPIIHEAVHRVSVPQGPPSVSMGVWGDAPRSGNSAVNKDKEAVIMNGGNRGGEGHCFGEVKLRRVSLDKNMHYNNNNNEDKTKNHRNSWHPSNQSYVNWQKPEVATKPIEVVFKNGRQREVMDNPSIAVVNAAKSKSGGHPALTGRVSVGGGVVQPPTRGHRDASRSRSSGDGREMETPPKGSYYHEEIYRKRSDGDGASSENNSLHRASYIETAAVLNKSAADHYKPSIEGWRGGERRWREVLTRKAIHKIN